MLISDEIRSRFLAYYTQRGHTLIPSASLLPEGDVTTLFTGSGMQPLIKYLLGEPNPNGKRLVNSQKCFRSEDIDEALKAPVFAAAAAPAAAPAEVKEEKKAAAKPKVEEKKEEDLQGLGALFG